MARILHIFYRNVNEFLIKLIQKGHILAIIERWQVVKR